MSDFCSVDQRPFRPYMPKYGVYIGRDWQLALSQAVMKAGIVLSYDQRDALWECVESLLVFEREKGGE